MKKSTFGLVVAAAALVLGATAVEQTGESTLDQDTVAASTKDGKGHGGKPQGDHGWD